MLLGRSYPNWTDSDASATGRVRSGAKSRAICHVQADYCIRVSVFSSPFPNERVETSNFPSRPYRSLLPWLKSESLEPGRRSSCGVVHSRNGAHNPAAIAHLRDSHRKFKLVVDTSEAQQWVGL